MSEKIYVVMTGYKNGGSMFVHAYYRSKEPALAESGTLSQNGSGDIHSYVIEVELYD